MTLPVVRSVGPPPERYANRIVAEMLRTIVMARARRTEQIDHVLVTTPDGNPRAQQKLAKKVKKLSGAFTLSVDLVKSGKRGRYTLSAILIDGWDAGRKDIIKIADAIPEKPWLAITCLQIVSKGSHAYEKSFLMPLVVTHHALSRLVQRFGGEITTLDLLTAVNNIWWAYTEEALAARKNNTPWPKEGTRLKFRLTEALSAFAILNAYEDGEGGIVVATIYY